MFDMFEVLENWKLSCDFSFLLLGVSDGHIFLDFSNYCPNINKDTSSRAYIQRINFYSGVDQYPQGQSIFNDISGILSTKKRIESAGAKCAIENIRGFSFPVFDPRLQKLSSKLDQIWFSRITNYLRIGGQASILSLLANSSWINFFWFVFAKKFPEIAIMLPRDWCHGELHERHSLKEWISRTVKN